MSDSMLANISEHSYESFKKSPFILRFVLSTLLLVFNQVSRLFFGRSYLMINSSQQQKFWKIFSKFPGFAQLRILMRATMLLKLVEIQK